MGNESLRAYAIFGKQFPANFHTQMIATNGTSLYVRVGGKGPAVVLLHGFGATGDMLSGNPKAIDADTRQHYAALYARLHAMHDAFEQFGAFRQDAADNEALLATGGKITMPVFAVGAEKLFGTGMADEMRSAASNVTGGIVPNSGHWIMEENPQATVELVTGFLAK